jgi:hypothetical protein
MEVNNDKEMEPIPSSNKSTVIFYDHTQLTLIHTARMISRHLAKNNISSNCVCIDSFTEMKNYLAQSSPWSVVYLFQTNLEGIFIKEDIFSWKKVAEIITTHSETHHIWGVGSAHQLLKYLENPIRVYIEGSDVIDLRLTVLFALWTTADILETEENEALKTKGEELRKSVIQDFCENINEIIGKSIVPVNSTGEKPPQTFDASQEFPTFVEEIPQYDEENNLLHPLLCLGPEPPQADYILLRRIMSSDTSVNGVVGWVINKLIEILIDKQFDDLKIHRDAAQEINEYVMSIVNGIQQEIADWFEDQGITVTDFQFWDAIPFLLPRQLFELSNLKDKLVEDAFYDMTHWFDSWIQWVLENPVQTKLSGIAPVLLLRVGTPINVGGFANFGAVLRIKLIPSFEIDRPFFNALMHNAIYEGLDLSGMPTVEDAFKEVQAFLDIIPLLEFDFAVCSFLSTEHSWVEAIFPGDLELRLFGSAHCQIAFRPVDHSETDRPLVEIREWGFHFELDFSYSLSIWDVLMPGPSSDIIDGIMDYAQDLFDVSIGIELSILFDITNQYASPGNPARSNLLLEILITVKINTRLFPVILEGTLSFGLRFEMISGPPNSAIHYAHLNEPSSIGAPPPPSRSSLRITVMIYVSMYLGINLLFTEIGIPWSWTFELSFEAEWGDNDYDDRALDFPDADGDGLPDAFETHMNDLYGLTYLDPNSADTDGDTLNDKLELQLMTLPNDSDTDDDGLTDDEEYLTYFTSLHFPDTERDGLTDYEECKTYGTNPFLPDTDGDGLGDHYEVTHVWDISLTTGTFGAVTSVEVGPYIYNDHTDPLNPDTDNDGLFDGDEGPNGIAYANDSEFNGNVNGTRYVRHMYTHPLDSDTDDDSVKWEILGENPSGICDYGPMHSEFMLDLNDGVEVFGQYIILLDADGYPEVVLVKTNPVNPDTDYDTNYNYATGPWYFNGDARELSLDPPTDPTDGDTDHDGIGDVKESFGPGGTFTNPTNPDTDNDGLPDYEDWKLPTDPRNPDSDSDGVSDGDEVYKYHTNPVMNDTDLDGLTDSEELFFFYSNPLVRDSDNDGLSDGEEVLQYLTDPLYVDSDRDGLADGFEVYISRTNPLDWDTDDDALGDGDELTLYNTNPLDWDTDDDSVSLPDENGEITFPWSDGDEVAYGTNPSLSDTDRDMLTDGQELYLGEGAQSFNPIPLDPLNNDTDNDGLMDGDELVLKEETTITYPFSALIIWLQYGSCPVLNDTDGDGLLDGEELQYRCDPTKLDTDGDSFWDYYEVYFTHTDPSKNDTDGDELIDSAERTDATVPNQNPQPLYQTDALDGDTDDDRLPDGLEIDYGTDPLNPDTDGDGILDGDEFDTDGDGLTDGDEFYESETWKTPIQFERGSTHRYLQPEYQLVRPPGGYDNPDSDGDGLTDGFEVLILGTDPTNSDTDGDGISDGDEFLLSEQTRQTFITGVIIGLASGFVVCIIIFIIIWFLLRRKSRSPQESEEPESKTGSSKESGGASKSDGGGG